MANLILKFVYNRKGQLNVRREAPIQMYIYLSGFAPVYLFTGFRVSPNQWDDESQAVRNHADQVNMNIALLKLKMQASTFHKDALAEGESVSPDDIRAHLSGGSQNNLIAFIERELDERTDLEPSSITNHRTLLVYLRLYPRTIPDLSRITPEWAGRFHAWLSRQEKVKGNGTLHPNYVASLMRYLKTYIAHAARLGLIKTNVLAGYTVKTGRTKKEWLEMDEVARMEQLTGLSDTEQKILTRFLFCCYAGIRYSDTNRLAARHFYRDDRGLRMRLKPQKTQKKNIEIDNPLYAMFAGKPQEIITPVLAGKSGGELVFGRLAQNQFNQVLKRLARRADITKRMSSHVARHTCAMALLNDGVPLNAVSKILGHAVTQTTEVYAHLLTRTVDEMIKSVYVKNDQTP